MKFVLLSDVHWLWDNPIGRLDNAHETQMEKLRFVFNWAYENNGAILQAGDLNDKPRNWDLLPVQISFLRSWYKKVTLCCVYGQHDTYMYSEKTRDKTNMGILAKAGLVLILDSNPSRSYEAVIYGAHYGQEAPKPEKKEPEQKNILVIHAPITIDPLFPDHVYDPAFGYLKSHPEYDLILCGDIHRTFLTRYEGRHIVNTGCLIRKEADEYNMTTHHPGFYVFDTDSVTCEWVEIPHKPAEEVLTRDHIERKNQINQMLQSFIDSVKDGGIKEGVSFQDNLAKFIKDNGIQQDVVDIISETISGEAL